MDLWIRDRHETYIDKKNADIEVSDGTLTVNEDLPLIYLAGSRVIWATINNLKYYIYLHKIVKDGNKTKYIFKII